MAIYIAAFNLAVLFAPIDILLSFWDVVGESGLHALQSEISAGLHICLARKPSDVPLLVRNVPVGPHVWLLCRPLRTCQFFFGMSAFQSPDIPDGLIRFNYALGLVSFSSAFQQPVRATEAARALSRARGAAVSP